MANKNIKKEVKKKKKVDSNINSLKPMVAQPEVPKKPRKEVQ
jgi:hypothetical protein